MYQNPNSIVRKQASTFIRNSEIYDEQPLRMKFATWNVFDVWNCDLRFWWPLWCILSIFVNRSYDFICWLIFFALTFLYYETSRSSERQNLAKTFEKWYLLEGARNAQEAKERLDINYDEDAWKWDMRFWWPLWCIYLLLWNWSMIVRGFKKQNLASV